MAFAEPRVVIPVYCLALEEISVERAEDFLPSSPNFRGDPFDDAEYSCPVSFDLAHPDGGLFVFAENRA